MDTSAQIARLEHEIYLHPSETGLQVNLKALQKRMSALEERFAKIGRD